MTKPKTKNSTTNQANRLSVQVTLTGLSFLITAPSRAVVHFSQLNFDTSHTPEELLFEMKKHISREVILQGPFDHVNVVYATHNYSVVPQSLFDEHKASEYLKFNTKILDNDYISFDQVDGINAVVVYIPFMNINNYLFDTFGSFSYFHASTLLIGALLSSEKHSETTRVFLHVLDGRFDCIVSKKGALELCNSYQYRTPADFIYYVLFCFEQLKLNPDSVEVRLCGAIDGQSDLYEILFTYVRKISFVEHEHHILSNDAAHQHFLLKSLV